MHALILGATGATGKDLLNLLLKNEAFQRVDVFVRRSIDIHHEKLKVHVIDFDKPEQWENLVSGDVLFSCLGTTLKAAGSKEAQWSVDYGYQYTFAKAARNNGVNIYVLVSASNASPSSPFFYAKMKGKLEGSVRDLRFPQCYIFRPPLLVRKDSDRSMENAAVPVLRFLNKMGLFTSQKPMPTELLARAMIKVASQGTSGTKVLEGEAIWSQADQ